MSYPRRPQEEYNGLEQMNPSAHCRGFLLRPERKQNLECYSTLRMGAQQRRERQGRRHTM